MLSGGGYQQGMSAWSALEQTPSFLTAGLSQNADPPILSIHKDFAEKRPDAPLDAEFVCPLTSALMNDPGKSYASLFSEYNSSS